MTSATHQEQSLHPRICREEEPSGKRSGRSGCDINYEGAELSWDELRRTGLVPDSDVSGEPTVLDAGVILGIALARCRSAVAARKLEFTAAVWGLERLLDSGRPEVPVGDDVELVAGAGNVQRVLADINGLAAASLDRLLQEPLPAGATAGVLDDSALAERGVSVRAVYRGDRALTPDQSRCAHRLGSAGVRVRLAPLVPVNMIIVDQRAVVLPTDPDRPADALAILHGDLWARLAGLIFEDTWQRATPPGR